MQCRENSTTITVKQQQSGCFVSQIVAKSATRFFQVTESCQIPSEIVSFLPKIAAKYHLQAIPPSEEAGLFAAFHCLRGILQKETEGFDYEIRQVEHELQKAYQNGIAEGFGVPCVYPELQFDQSALVKKLQTNKFLLIDKLLCFEQLNPYALPDGSFLAFEFFIGEDLSCTIGDLCYKSI